MLDPGSAVRLVKDELFGPWEKERDRLAVIDRWARWHQEDVKIPREASAELKALVKLSKTPWLGLVVTTIAQCMYVDGYRSPLDGDTDQDPPRGPWRAWLANQFARRQVAVHRAALTYGYSFVTVLPGDTAAVMRGVSPRKMFAVYEDPAEDDWPRYAMKADLEGKTSWRLRLLDHEWVYHLRVDNLGKVTYLAGEEQRHGAGVCPVVRFCNQLDLDGRTPGEVEPFISAAARINKTAYDRLVTQHFSSWKVRTVAGMAQPDTTAEKEATRLLLRQQDLLIAEDPDTRFGTLDETPLDGFVGAWRADIEALAAVSQTPTHALTGQLVNLSAEALAAARAALTQKVHERQTSFGEAHGQALRLAAALQGDTDYATDVAGRVSWQDMEIRSMSQAVDALGKAAQMLQVPPEVLWARIPGVEKTDVDEWRRVADRADPLTRFEAELERQAEPVGA